MRLLTVLFALVFLPAAALAQTPGSCDPGTAETDLNVGDVQARLFNTGSLFFGGSTTNGTGYLVPKGEGTPPIFAAGVWVGGLIGGDLRTAGSRYDDFEFWPGPLDDGATLPEEDCSSFDRIWNVSVFDVQQFDDTGVATPDLAEWPADLGAPVVDGNGDPDDYDLEGGDRPLVYGHQTAFWVMNDVGNTHLETGSDPIGLEVRVTAFTSGELALDRYTFYRYELVNRNTAPFEDAYLSFFTDPDLGGAVDDYVGSDPARSMAFAYNADNDDAVYGTPPPAVGYDLLTGGASSSYFENAPGPTSDPGSAAEFYNYMRGLWKDGIPITRGGNGYMTDGDVTPWAFSGDPAADAFWSEVNADGDGQDNPSGDRRQLISSPAFTLAPGASQTFDLAIVFAEGSDNLDSVTELRAVSDAVQTRYDEDDLFVPGPTPPAPGALATPDLLAPSDEATIVDASAVLSWSAVSGAETYRVEVATDADFSDREVSYVSGTTLTFEGDVNEVTDYVWRVQATARGLLTSVFSDARTFTLYRYEFDNFGEGVGIVEIASPDGDPCGGSPDDPGCSLYGGNAVWLDANSTGDYVVTNPDNDLSELLQFPSVIDGDNFEMRFTSDCATAGNCLGVFASTAPGNNDDLIASVPFELWNTGSENGDTDEVRMIPLLRAPSGADPSETWADTFPATENVTVGMGTESLGVTHRVLWMMPDRADGYALFAAAAGGFGGVGATYDADNDGDTQVDPGPDGQDCRSQGYYIDYCYRGGGTRLVPPIGGLDGMQIADLADDGTTPAAGTLIRLDAEERLLTDAEDEGLGLPSSFALGASYPNPFSVSATVPFELQEAGTVRLAVVDVLGREVAVLTEGTLAAGVHRATLDGSRLASGVYFVVLEADGQRQVRKMMRLR
ncbi:MAG: T9SS type A sorting domain-containing protein [Bacteroidota bacterium]